VSDFVWTFLEGCFNLLWKMFVIVVPIMVVLELFEGSRPFRALVRGWARIVGRLGMTAQTAIPTLVGFLFGLAYGGGVIVRETKRHELGRRQVFLMDVFLSQVHAVIEDSLVFAAVGASLAWVIGFRLVWAVAVTAVLGAVAGAVVRRRRAGPDETATAFGETVAGTATATFGTTAATADELLDAGVVDGPEGDGEAGPPTSILD
jgi:hypothetical protein